MTDLPTEAAIFEIEDRRFRAMAANDVAALGDLLADDLHYVHANGIVEDKAEFLRKIASGERLYRDFSSIERSARQEGGFTFVFGRASVVVDRAAGRLENELTYTAVYRHAAAPLLLAWHAVKSAG